MSSLKRKQKDTTTAYYFSLEPYGLEDDEVEIDPDNKKKQKSVFDLFKKNIKDSAHNKFLHERPSEYTDRSRIDNSKYDPGEDEITE